jgi:DNA polymerase I-like protein with 3'-5' exonuclease and polymerase domains
MGEKSAKKERENKGGVKYTYGTARMAILLDMKRAREEAEFAGMVIPKRNLIWDCDQADLVHYLENFMREEEVAFDIETLGNWPDRIAFASKHIAVSFLINRAKEQVAEILAKHEGLIAQNGMFDVKILKKNGLPVGRLYADTMICHNLLYPEWPHGLDFLASIYTKLAEPPHCPGWDSVGNRGRKNAEHAAITLEVWKKLEQELKEVENVQQKA